MFLELQYKKSSINISNQVYVIKDMRYNVQQNDSSLQTQDADQI